MDIKIKEKYSIIKSDVRTRQIPTFLILIEYYLLKICRYKEEYIDDL